MTWQASGIRSGTVGGRAVLAQNPRAIRIGFRTAWTVCGQSYQLVLWSLPLRASHVLHEVSVRGLFSLGCTKWHESVSDLLDKGSLCPQLLQQRLRLLQVRRVKPFGKPTVHGREQVVCVLALLPSEEQLARTRLVRESTSCLVGQTNRENHSLDTASLSSSWPRRLVVRPYGHVRRRCGENYARSSRSALASITSAVSNPSLLDSGGLIRG